MDHIVCAYVWSISLSHMHSHPPHTDYILSLCLSLSVCLSLPLYMFRQGTGFEATEKNKDFLCDFEVETREK